MRFLADSAQDELNAVRQAMLEVLGERVPQPYTTLLPRILHAVDAQRLWHLRAELMQALAAMHGEAHATAQLAQVTERFEGLVPPALLGRRFRCSSRS